MKKATLFLILFIFSFMIFLFLEFDGSGMEGDTPEATRDGGATFQQGRVDKKYLQIDISGSGDGKVLITPSEMECSRAASACSFGFNPGTEVVLTAHTQGIKNNFDGWIGKCDLMQDSGHESCTIRLNEDRHITAVFSEIKNRTFYFPMPGF
jgi:hypothetical protein